MKLSCLPVSYFKEIINGSKSILDWAKEGKNLGLDAVDISVLFIRNKTKKELIEIRDKLSSLGIGIAVTTTYPDFTHPDAEHRKREIDLFLEDMNNLSLLGTKYIRITSGQAHPDTKREEGIKWALEGFSRIIEPAEKLRIQLVFENHAKPGVWEYPDFAFPTDIFLEIADNIKETPIKILFDTANPVAFGDDPIKLLSKVINRVVCMHISDTEVKGALKPVVIGTGVVPLKSIFLFLKEGKYDGWLCIEEASNKGEQGIIRAINYIKENCLTK